MDSINRQMVQERIGNVYDTMAGAQLNSKAIGKYVKVLREAVNAPAEVKSETSEFLKDFGAGI